MSPFNAVKMEEQPVPTPVPQPMVEPPMARKEGSLERIVYLN
jgi:hypothetical protein